MHSTVAKAAQIPNQRANSQSARSAVCSTAVRKANREAVAVLGGKSMILVCIFSPLKALVSSAVHRVAAESCNENADSAVIAGNAGNVSRRNPWSAASLARPTGRRPWWGEALGRQGECSKIVLVVDLWRAIGRCANTQNRKSTRGKSRAPEKSVEDEDDDEYEDECLGLSPGRSSCLLFFNLTSDPGRNTLATRAW
jgi:hypothetical protein